MHGYFFLQESPALRIASDYMSREEADAKFKKPKKKKKKVKKTIDNRDRQDFLKPKPFFPQVKKTMLKADDLLGGAEESFGSRNKRKKQEEEGGGGFRAVGGFDQDEEEEEEGLNIRPAVPVKVRPVVTFLSFLGSRNETCFFL